MAAEVTVTIWTHSNVTGAAAHLAAEAAAKRLRESTNVEAVVVHAAARHVEPAEVEAAVSAPAEPEVPPTFDPTALYAW